MTLTGLLTALAIAGLSAAVVACVAAFIGLLRSGRYHTVVSRGVRENIRRFFFVQPQTAEHPIPPKQHHIA